MSTHATKRLRIKLTLSRVHNQEPRHTWGCGQWVRPSHRLPRHPTPRASQRQDQGCWSAHRPAILRASRHPYRQFHKAHPHPSQRAAMTSVYRIAKISKCQLTFLASGSGIFFSSTHVEGLESVGSSISLEGLTGGVKSSRRLPVFTVSPLKRTS